jgi:hypothetical protein
MTSDQKEEMVCRYRYVSDSHLHQEEEGMEKNLTFEMVED